MRALKSTAAIAFSIVMILIGAICFYMYLENSAIESDFNQMKAKLLLIMSFAGVATSLLFLSSKEAAQVILGQDPYQ